MIFGKQFRRETYTFTGGTEGGEPDAGVIRDSAGNSTARLVLAVI
jgi:hypothetical protein